MIFNISNINVILIKSRYYNVQTSFKKGRRGKIFNSVLIASKIIIFLTCNRTKYIQLYISITEIWKIV